jgi:hypothetical protein
MTSASVPTIERKTINRHAEGVFPAMAMLAGMQLDVFTPLKDGPLPASDIAAAIGVKVDKLTPLLYALVVAELLTVDAGRFGNTPEADTYLVRGRSSYLRGEQDFYADIWQAMLKTATTIRTGVPQHKHDFYGMAEDEMVFFFEGLHRRAVTAGSRACACVQLFTIQTPAGRRNGLGWSRDRRGSRLPRARRDGRRPPARHTRRTPVPGRSICD